jgi:RING finger protein 121
MHAEMVLVLLLVLVISQVLLVIWKTKHFKSFQVRTYILFSILNVCILLVILIKFATMIGMWIIPFLISVKYYHIRFIIIWFFFTLITLMVAIRATRSPIERTTPRLFYKWFLLVHKVSYILGIVGYVGLMLSFLGFNFLFFVSPTVIITNNIHSLNEIPTFFIFF